MVKLKRQSWMLLVIVVVLGLVLVGCSNNKENNGNKVSDATATPAATAEATTEVDPNTPDISEKVSLKVVLIGVGGPESEAAYKSISEMAEKDLNATVEVRSISQEAYNLMLTSGEDFDLAYAADWTGFADGARKGAFYEISDEMLEKFAPNIAKSNPAVIEAGKVDGKLFGIASSYLNVNNSYFYVVRGDLMEKYNISDINSLDDFEAYLDAVATNEKGMIPYDVGVDRWVLPATVFALNNLNAAGAANFTNPLQTNLMDPQRTVLKTLEQQAIIDYSKRMKVWNEKGYWSKNALVNQTSSSDSFKSGKSAATIIDFATINYLYADVFSANPEWDVKIYDAVKGNNITAYSYMNRGTAINAKSKNAERALMLLDKLTWDEAYYMLSSYGVEGRNYTLDGNGKIAFSNENPFGAGNGWTNPEYMKVIASSYPGYEALASDIESRFKADILADFKADLTSLSNIGAIFSDVFSQYGFPRMLGFVDDVDKAIELENKKYIDGGLEEYRIELQKQIDAFLASKK